MGANEGTIQKNMFFLFQRFNPSLFDEYDATHSDLSPAAPWTTRRWSPPLPSSQAILASPRHCNGIFIFYNEAHYYDYD